MVFLLVLFAPDDVYSGHGEHSEMLRLFIIGNGCFVVSFLICMFQDSVPAGSYNDPFLSSVCVSVCMHACMGGSMEGCMAGWLAGWMDGMNECMHTCMHACL